MSGVHRQGMLAYSYSKRERDWIVMRLEGHDWKYVRIATPEDRETLPLYGWPPDEWTRARRNDNAL